MITVKYSSCTKEEALHELFVLRTVKNNQVHRHKQQDGLDMKLNKIKYSVIFAYLMNSNCYVQAVDAITLKYQALCKLDFPKYNNELNDGKHKNIVQPYTESNNLLIITTILMSNCSKILYLFPQ